MKIKKQISNVPTNIITGFLGSGKTTSILHLLKSKPENERWAVLVNEFGEIGVDGILLEGQYGENQGVFVREVPGGCMCCTSGLPMQIALTALLALARPDRLLIEPTGLGHPIEVLSVLSSEYYKEILTINKILTLVDARRLSDSRYANHKIFKQQIEIADIIVGNKSDLYQEEDRKTLKSYALEHGAPYSKTLVTEKGILEFSLLQGNTRAVGLPQHSPPFGLQQQTIEEIAIPETGYVKVENQGEGFKSVGWRFKPCRVFDRDKLYLFLNGINVERMKSVFICESGIFGYNLTSDALTEVPIDECLESRIEIIASNVDDSWETQLLDCIATD